MLDKNSDKNQTDKKSYKREFIQIIEATLHLWRGKQGKQCLPAVEAGFY